MISKNGNIPKEVEQYKYAFIERALEFRLREFRETLNLLLLA